MEGAKQNLKITSIALDPGKLQSLRLTATVEGTTVSAMIRQLIDEKLSKSSYIAIKN